MTDQKSKHARQDERRRAFNFKLNPDLATDAVLIEAIDNMPRGVLSEVIRKAISEYISKNPA